MNIVRLQQRTVSIADASCIPPIRECLYERSRTHCCFYPYGSGAPERRQASKRIVGERNHRIKMLEKQKQKKPSTPPEPLKWRIVHNDNLVNAWIVPYDACDIFCFCFASILIL